jgi:uncharacterized delta-60 repeat protein
MFVRYNADSSLDESFGNAGIAIVPVSTGFLLGNQLAIQADGKIIGFGFYDKRRDAHITHPVAPIVTFAAGRFNPDGSPDTIFGMHGRAIAPIENINISFGLTGALQSDGKILIGGNTQQAGALRAIAIVRLLGDASVHHVGRSLISMATANPTFRFSDHQTASAYYAAKASGFKGTASGASKDITIEATYLP